MKLAKIMNTTETNQILNTNIYAVRDGFVTVYTDDVKWLGTFPQCKNLYV